MSAILFSSPIPRWLPAGRDRTRSQFAAWPATFSDGPGSVGVSSSAAGAFFFRYHSSHCSFQSDGLVPSKNPFDVRTKWQVFPFQSGGGPWTHRRSFTFLHT